MVKRMLMLRVIAALACLAGSYAPAWAEVEVTIDRNPVQVNESFQLVFSLDHSPSSDPDFSTLQQHFMILGNNRSNSISIINGEYHRSVKWTLQLMPKQIGEFVIPAISFGDERSEPFEVTVKQSSIASVPQDQQVLELTLDNSEVYVQSQVVLTMRLLSATDIAAYQFGDIDTHNVDLVIEPLGDVRQYQTSIADRSYLVLEKQFALFPQQSGLLEIPPVLAEVRLPSRSSFDPFNASGKVRRFRSQPLLIDVKPIPAGFSGDYWLPAERVELREQWPADLNGLVAGEPITRSITLAADGLTAAQLPEIELQPIDGIKQYPDQPLLQDSRGNAGISSQRVQKVALIPGAAGLYHVPEIKVNWWNRKTGKMETASLPERKLVVAGAAPLNPLETATTSALTPQDSGGALPAAAPGRRFWPWLSLFLALGWLSTLAYGWSRRQRRQRGQQTSTAEGASPDLAHARTELQQACREDNAVAARAALLDWGRALLAPRQVANLRELGEQLGADLQLEVDALNRSLYAGEQQAWHGQSLWSLCQQLEKTARAERHDASSTLLPLNP